MVTNQVFTIAGAKGGVGKTTTTLNVAAALDDTDHSVVAIEMDLPMPNFADFLEFEFDPSKDPNLHDVLDDAAGLQEAIYETTEGLSVIPSVSEIATYEQTDLSRFPEIIDELRWYFDLIFIDTPAGLSEEAKQSLAAGDQALIISTPRVASIQNATKTIEFARQQEASIGGFLLNKSGSGASPGVDTIAEAVEVEVLGHIPEDEAVPHAQDLGVPVVTQSPNSAAGIAYQRIARGLVDADQSRNSTAAPSKPADDSSETTTPDEDDEHHPADNSAVEEQPRETEGVESDPAKSTKQGIDGHETSANKSAETPAMDGGEAGDVPQTDQEIQQSSNPSDPPESTAPSDSLMKKLRQAFRSD